MSKNDLSFTAVIILNILQDRLQSSLSSRTSDAEEMIDITGGNDVGVGIIVNELIIDDIDNQTSDSE